MFYYKFYSSLTERVPLSDGHESLLRCYVLVWHVSIFNLVFYWTLFEKLFCVCYHIAFCCLVHDSNIKHFILACWKMTYKRPFLPCRYIKRAKAGLILFQKPFDLFTRFKAACLFCRFRCCWSVTPSVFLTVWQLSNAPSGTNWIFSCELKWKQQPCSQFLELLWNLCVPQQLCLWKWWKI